MIRMTRYITVPSLYVTLNGLGFWCRAWCICHLLANCSRAIVVSGVFYEHTQYRSYGQLWPRKPLPPTSDPASKTSQRKAKLPTVKHWWKHGISFTRWPFNPDKNLENGPWSPWSLPSGFQACPATRCWMCQGSMLTLTLCWNPTCPDARDSLMSCLENRPKQVLFPSEKIAWLPWLVSKGKPKKKHCPKSLQILRLVFARIWIPVFLFLIPLLFLILLPVPLLLFLDILLFPPVPSIFPLPLIPLSLPFILVLLMLDLLLILPVILLPVLLILFPTGIPVIPVPPIFYNALLGVLVLVPVSIPLVPTLPTLIPRRTWGAWGTWGTWLFPLPPVTPVLLLPSAPGLSGNDILVRHILKRCKGKIMKIDPEIRLRRKLCKLRFNLKRSKAGPCDMVGGWKCWNRLCTSKERVVGRRCPAAHTSLKVRMEEVMWSHVSVCVCACSLWFFQDGICYESPKLLHSLKVVTQSGCRRNMTSVGGNRNFCILAGPSTQAHKHPHEQKQDGVSISDFRCWEASKQKRFLAVIDSDW